jgi:hypothetical protein
LKLFSTPPPAETGAAQNSALHAGPAPPNPGSTTAAHIVTSPLQSLAGRGSTPPAEASFTFPRVVGNRLRRLAAPVSRHCHSLGVDLSFRVSRLQLATHWFVAPASTFGLSTRSLPSSLEPLLVPTMSTPVGSPRELHLSLRVPSLPPGPTTACLLKQTDRNRAPLMRSLSLQRLKIEASTHRGIAYAATFRPRRFSRPRRFAPLRPVPGSPPGNTLGFHALQGNSRLAGDPAVSDAISPPGVASAAPA